MGQTNKKLPLEKRMFISFVAVATALLLLTLGITLYFDIDRQNRNIDANISNTAAYIASMDSVGAMLENGYPNDEVKKTLDSLSNYFPDLNVIAVYNREGLRFYHTNRQETGETFMEGIVH